MRFLLLFIISASANADFYVSSKLGYVFNERDSFNVVTTNYTSTNRNGVHEFHEYTTNESVDFGHWLNHELEIGYETRCFNKFTCALGLSHDSKVFSSARKEYFQDEVFFKIKYTWSKK
jgi:hypothetical protein